MWNVFKVKSYAALLLPQTFTVLVFFVLISFFDFWYAIGGFVLSLLIFTLIGRVLLRNPFTDMIEGSGLLTLKMDSTGVVVPYTISISGNMISGSYAGKNMNDVWDRNATYQITEPVAIQSKFEVDEDGNATIKMSSKEFNAAKMRLATYPMLLYNEQLDTLITKDWFSHNEKDMFAQHILLMNNRQLQDLNVNFRDFARSVIELLRPTLKSITGSKWFWVILVVVIGGLAAMFAPKIIGYIQGAGTKVVAGGSQAVAGTTTQTAQTITPR